jgi:hypothetical protein
VERCKLRGGRIYERKNIAAQKLQAHQQPYPHQQPRSVQYTVASGLVSLLVDFFFMALTDISVPGR